MEKELMEKVLTKLDKEFEGIANNFKMVNAKLDEHDKEFEEIANNFKMVNTKLDEHDKEFEEIANNFKKINAKLDEHDKEFEEIANNFKMVNTKLDKHDKEFRDLERYWFVFEDKVTTELPALFDGYSANIEKSTEIEFRQNATEKKVELDSLRISILEDNFKKHDEQLSKLLAE